MRCAIWRGIAVAICLALAKDTTADEPPSRGPVAVQLATFVADITPALGEIIDTGMEENGPRARIIDHPILAKGIVLKDAGGVYVLCAFDWANICNESHAVAREKLAAAAGTTASRVAAQTLHLGTAPAMDATAQRILDQVPGAPPTSGGIEYFEKSMAAVAAAVRDATKRLQPVTQVGTGFAPADRLASSRRIRLPDGTIGTRLTSCTDPIGQMWPEGKIDGFLRTVSFFNGDRPLAALHYYAVHPISHYGDGQVTYDVAGLARERLQKETEVFQVYFSGCACDIAFGKYNDGALSNRAVLADRLHDAMLRSSNSIQKRQPVAPICWKSVELRLGPRREPEFSEAVCRKTLQDATAKPVPRIKAAMMLAFIERMRAGSPLDLSCLTIGPAKILNLPGEMFVEYQLFAQQAAQAGTFVAVASFGDCALQHVCTNEAYTDRGGYEQTWSFVEPSEQVLKEAIEQALQDLGR